MGINFIKSSIMHSWTTLTIVCVSLICVRLVYARHYKNKVHFHTEFWLLVSAIYLMLLYEMLTRADININSGINLIPFKEILRYDITSKQFFYLIIGNIAVFVPFGYIIAYYAKPEKIWSNIFVGIIVSSTIELVQKQIGRSFDIDDIILNTLGCAIGFLVYHLGKKILNHLPDFFQSDWFKNLICIIITICIGVYLVKVAGII